MSQQKRPSSGRPKQSAVPAKRTAGVPAVRKKASSSRRPSASKAPAKGRPAVRRKKRRINKMAVWTLVLIFFLFLELFSGLIGVFAVNRMRRNEPELIIDDFFSQEELPYL